MLGFDFRQLVGSGAPHKREFPLKLSVLKYPLAVLGMGPVRLLYETLKYLRLEKSSSGIFPVNELFQASNLFNPEILFNFGKLPEKLLNETSSFLRLFNVERELGNVPDSWFLPTWKRVSLRHMEISGETSPVIAFSSRIRKRRDFATAGTLQGSSRLSCSSRLSRLR